MAHAPVQLNALTVGRQRNDRMARGREIRQEGERSMPRGMEETGEEGGGGGGSGGGSGEGRRVEGVG